MFKSIKEKLILIKANLEIKHMFQLPIIYLIVLKIKKRLKLMNVQNKVFVLNLSLQRLQKNMVMMVLKNWQ
ncbi:hypothetical protein [Spiroplasma endosymbiont of Cantharis lateralis]|uniref:hypothetical protein n=1 Tax=Spiroplasma endosymbiont of Cantharis lateralis TaxID=3066277 RepID=UPI00313E8B3D